jgi:hypothetical protein
MAIKTFGLAGAYPSEAPETLLGPWPYPQTLD